MWSFHLADTLNFPIDDHKWFPIQMIPDTNDSLYKWFPIWCNVNRKGRIEIGKRINSHAKCAKFSKFYILNQQNTGNYTSCFCNRYFCCCCCGCCWCCWYCCCCGYCCCCCFCCCCCGGVVVIVVVVIVVLVVLVWLLKCCFYFYL